MLACRTIIHKINVNSHNFRNRQFLIEERRRDVARLVARCMSQTSIAEELGVDQSTISADIKALKEMSKQFIFDLAKSDMASYYRENIDGVDDVTEQAWKLYSLSLSSAGINKSAIKTALECLKVILLAKETKNKLLNEGPNMLAISAMSERLNQIERSFQEENR